MENASKALIIAGGILIAILVLSALLLMFTNLSDYQRSNSEIVKSEQLSKFNEEFTQYYRNDLEGVDLISLANKVVDYNKRSGGVGEIKYDQKITLTIKIDQRKFKNMLKTDPQVFNESEYVINESTANTSSFFKQITIYRNYEENNSLNNMKKLVSQMDGIKDGDITVEEIIGRGNVFKDENGNAITDKNDIYTALTKYQEYSSFKSATFKPSDTASIDYYENGQVRSMTIEFVK